MNIVKIDEAILDLKYFAVWDHQHQRKGKRSKKDWEHVLNKLEQSRATRELVIPMQNTEYARVMRIYGEGRLLALCSDKITRVCKIRGNMWKVHWIDVNDVLLVSPRLFQQSGKADVLLKYTQKELSQLRELGDLNLKNVDFPVPGDDYLNKMRSCLVLEEDDYKYQRNEEESKEQEILCLTLSKLCIKSIIRHFLFLFRDLWKISIQLQDDILAALIYLNPTIISDEVLSEFLFPFRYQLIVRSCHLVSNNSINNIAKICTNLRVLDISSCWKVTDLSTKHLFDRCRKLEVLYISNCKRLTDKTLEKLVQYCKSSIVSIDASGCSHFSPESIRQVCQKCPILKEFNVLGCAYGEPIDTSNWVLKSDVKLVVLDKHPNTPQIVDKHENDHYKSYCAM